MLPSARGFRRLIEQYTDEYVLHQASLRTRRSLGHEFGQERHRRLLAVMRRAGARAWRVSAAAVLIFAASTVGTYSVLAHVRLQEFSDARASFEDSWEAADFAAISGLFPLALREQQGTRMAGTTAGHGWADALPPLGPGRERADEGSIWVDCEVGGLALATHWSLIDRPEALLEASLPEPPLEPALAQFIEAWNSSDLGAVASFVPAGYRERAHEAWVLSAGYRDWEVLPPVLGTQRDPAPEGGGQVQVILQLERGQLTTRWLFSHSGRWGLQMLRFPER